MGSKNIAVDPALDMTEDEAAGITLDFTSYRIAQSEQELREAERKHRVLLWLDEHPTPALRRGGEEGDG